MKMSAKGAQFFHLACQGRGSHPCSPVSYAADKMFLLVLILWIFYPTLPRGIGKKWIEY